jgi:hypothetical protein
MFLYTINPITKKKQITLKPILNEVLLDKIMTQTRYSIIKLYLNCEKDFTVGLNIYQAIVNKKILETSPNQVITLERERDILATSIQNAEPDVVIEPRVIDNSMVDNRKPIDDGNPLQNLPTPQIGLPTEVKNENVQFETQVKPILVEEKGVQQIV